MNKPSEPSGPRRRQHVRRRQRRAVVAVIVLLLIAVALATSYSVMRSQTVTLSVRENAMLGVSARRAALTGLTAGLREMHSPYWTGTGTTFSQALGPNEGFQVQFIAGDATLTATDPDYAEVPYRVTLAVTGTASDPADANRTSQHAIRAVARLIPRAMPDEPLDWSTMQRFTLYQTAGHDTTFDIPCRIEGDVRLQQRLKLGEHYPNDPDAWWDYFYHQNVMRSYGFEDARTFTGHIYLPFGSQDPIVCELLSWMSIPVTYQDPHVASSDWTKPQDLLTYRVFDGGPEYIIPQVAATLQNQQLRASPAENPLGLFYVGGNLTVNNDVTVRGTLFCRDDITITGVGVRFESVDLPPLYGSSLPVRLPAVTCRNLKVEPGASCTVNGLMASFGVFEVRKGSPRGRLNVTGRVIASDFDVKEDDGWCSVAWSQQYTDFRMAYSFDHFPWPLFTVWMAKYGYPYEPTVLVKPGDSAQYHWQRSGESIFVPHADDFSATDAGHTPGLRWELIEVAHETN